MLSAVRGGPALRRALRAIAPSRSSLNRQAYSPTSWRQLSAFPSTLQSHSIHFSSSLRSAQTAVQAPSLSTPTGDNDVVQPITEFQQLADRGLVDSRLISTIRRDMNINEMTDVQKLTIPESLRGGDIFGQAKTGTGKTLAFLLPVLQKILKDPDFSTSRRNNSRSHARASDIRAIIISPTRELAEQIAMEARKVASRSGIMVQTAVGGTQKRLGLIRIQNNGCHVLVATPGRLLDILSDPTSGVETPLLTTLVLDEADRLLEVGFAEDITQIRTLLGKSTLPEFRDKLQTLMFSATIPKEVKQMVRRTLRPEYTFLRTVQDNEVPVHVSVKQSAVFLSGYENAYPAVLEIAKKYINEYERNRQLPPFKSIVYFNTTAEVRLAFEAFQNLRSKDHTGRSSHPLGRILLHEIHSRLSQGQRTRAADDFRNANSGILFSSDVTARGMDFPDVTHVIQVGLPKSREGYIHRLGRTARAKKGGEGWLLIHDLEYDNFQSSLGDLPIQEDQTSVATALVDMSLESDQLAPHAAETLTQIKQGMRSVPSNVKSEAYMALLGATRLVGNPQDHVRALNKLAINGWQLEELPGITRGQAMKRGLSKVRGLRIADEDAWGGSTGSHGPGSFDRRSSRFQDRQPPYSREFGRGRVKSRINNNVSKPFYNSSSESSMSRGRYDRQSATSYRE